MLLSGACCEQRGFWAQFRGFKPNEVTRKKSLPSNSVSSNNMIHADGFRWHQKTPVLDWIAHHHFDSSRPRPTFTWRPLLNSYPLFSACCLLLGQAIEDMGKGAKGKLWPRGNRLWWTSSWSLLGGGKPTFKQLQKLLGRWPVMLIIKFTHMWKA